MIKDQTVKKAIESMAQIKSDCPENTILMFKLGQFTYLFGPDAEIASNELSLFPLIRYRKSTSIMGFPTRDKDKYITRLKGYHVVVCTQMA